jgi:hypothetical protein
MLAEAAKAVVHTVAEKRATFGRSNVFVEVPRQFHRARFATADDRMTFASGGRQVLVYEWGKPATRVAVHGQRMSTPGENGPLGAVWV